MINYIRKSIIAKIIAVYVAFYIVFGNGIINNSYAGSNTPAATEFASSSGGNLVDPFTGDFHYNIPLMEVPGPNGSFPISISYSSSNVSMETDAGWVGLGWNLNLGSVTRDMKGLPDDFKGDAVTKSYNLKDNKYWLFDADASGIFVHGKELLGFDLAIGFDIQLYHSTYTGLGLGFGIAPTAHIAKFEKIDEKTTRRIASGSTSFSFHIDSQKGCDMSYATSLNSRFGGFAKNGSLNTRTGKTTGFPKSSSKVGYVPGLSFPTTSSFGTYFVQFGAEISPTKYETFNARLMLSSSSVNSPESLPSYGYMYSQYASGQKELMDFNFENNTPPCPEIPAIPNPVLLADDFYASGPVSGSFRAFRSDIGILSPEKRTVSETGQVLGGEVGLGTIFKAGADIGDISTDNYSGIWKTNANELTNHVDFYDTSITNQKFEPYYFKMTSEINRSSTELINATGGYAPVRLNIDLGSDHTPYVHNLFTASAPYSINTYKQSSRTVRETNIQMFTVGEVTNNEYWADRVDYLWNAGEYPNFPSSTGLTYSYPSVAKDHHIGKIVMTDPTGMASTYGIPVYTTQHDEVYYSTSGTSAYNNPYTSGVTSGEAGTGNSSGRDNFYLKNSIPPYASTFLLTSVTAPDYVDLTHNGPSDDDLGFFAKLNYSRVYYGSTPYKWRSPYKNSYFVTTNYSDTEDDQATYNYGTKEVFYANSVETKTHIAVFELDDRADARETSGEFNTASASGTERQLQLLKSIKLYSKNDLTTPLQTVEFTYDYSLCQGWDANSTGGGKLTLKKIVINYLDNDKGTNSPYEFTYSATNPNYNVGQVDKWGVPADASITSTFDWDPHRNPYQVQGDYNKDGVLNSADASSLNANVSAWLLTNISTPGDGRIAVTYESDDFGYVQNIKAKSLFQVVGTSTTDDYTYVDSGTHEGRINKNYRRIYFRLQKPITGSSSTDADVKNEIFKYINGLSQVYFKAFVKMKDDKYDYVECYGQVDASSSDLYGVDDSHGASGTGPYTYTVGYITVKAEKYNTYNSTNPITKACWQLMRMDRVDFTENPALASGGGAVAETVGAFFSLISSISEIVGYYNNANIHNWGEKIQLETFSSIHPKTSFVKLNCVSAKTGGGARVSKLMFTDNWTEGSADNGYTYQYINMDGTSSGVAANEPQTAPEDNSIKDPEFYTADQNVVYKSDRTFLMKPYNESAYPDPVVGYSRVVVTPLNNVGNTINKANKGIVVNQFYTAKDFPVISQTTGVKDVTYADATVTWMPMGYVGYDMVGYSQGFYCEVNDMHGKPKKTETYQYMADISAASPISTVEYNYFTDPANPGRLKNDVTTLVADHQTATETLGEYHEFYIAMEEHSSFTDNSVKQVNVDVPAFPVIIPTLWPEESTDQVMYRSVATNKIVRRNGILKEIVTTNNGAVSKFENLCFDPYTGQALITSKTNSFEQPLYDYALPAYWDYAGMHAAYQNCGSFCKITAASGAVTYTNANQYFYPGDVLQASNGYEYYVTTVSSTGLTLEKADGTSPSFTSVVKIIRSGYRNMIALPHGKIISLSDPNGARGGFAGLMAYYNANITGHTFGDNTSISIMDFETCAGENEVDIIANSTEILFDNNESRVTCGAKLQLDDETYSTLPSSDLTLYTIVSYNAATGQVVVSYNDMGTPILINFTWSDTKNCFPNCFKVLHADATEYSDEDWTYNYTDAGSPVGEGSTPLSVTSINEYRYGKKGIWRAKRTNLFVIGRDANGTTSDFHTKIDIDGQYHTFNMFNWNDPSLNAINWLWAQENTIFSPYGYGIELKDKLGVYASKLYSNANSALAAKAANSTYYETAFDAFDDYGSTYTLGDGHGHLNLVRTDNPVSPIVLSDVPHTGKKAARLGGSYGLVFSTTVDAASPDYFTPVAGKDYLVSGWFKKDNPSFNPGITIYDQTASAYITPFVTYNNYQEIDGWVKYEAGFTAPATGHVLNIEWKVGSEDEGYVDDIRIHPFKAAMVSSVYDPVTLWKLADLDNQNYATFYNYDELGHVIQVKKETANGIVTVSTGRSNIKQ